MNHQQVLHVPIESAKWPHPRPWARLDELCKGIFDCPHSTPRLTEQGPLLVRSQDIRSGVFRWDEAAHVSEEAYAERVARAEPSVGDILYSREGTYFGIAAEMPVGQRVCLGQRMVLIRPDRAKLNSRFLKYWLNSPILSTHIRGFRDGSVAERLNMPTIRGLPVPLFSQREQESIGDALGSLDDKIELNRWTNRALEEIAEAIFEAWFINFEPVKAKMAGTTSFRGMPQIVFDQLPSRLAESKLGLVPEGWQGVPVGELVEVIGGSTPSTKNPQFWDGGDYPFCTPKDMSKLTSPVLLDTERHITRAGVARISSRQLPVGTVLLSSRAPIGYLALAETPVSVNQGIIAMLTGDIPNSYALLWAKTNMDMIKARAGGTTFAEISKSNFRTLLALRPDAATLKAFEELVRPVFNLITINERESRTLSSVRDTLVPRLMSGVIRYQG